MKISRLAKKVYGFFAVKLYKMTGKKGMVPTLEFYDTPTMTKYHHIVSALRYVAVEEYYGKNDFGMTLYKTANRWESEKALQEDLDRFYALIHSIETKGYDMNSSIYVDLDGNCFNGTHRLALCAWFGVKEMPVMTVKRHLKTQTIPEMKEYYRLSEDDFQRLECAYQRMREKLSEN